MGIKSKLMIEIIRMKIDEAQMIMDELDSKDICEVIDLFADYYGKNAEKSVKIMEEVSLHIVKSEKIMNSICKVLEVSSDFTARLMNDQDMIKAYQGFMDSVQYTVTKAEYKTMTPEDRTKEFNSLSEKFMELGDHLSRLYKECIKVTEEVSVLTSGSDEHKSLSEKIDEYFNKIKDLKENISGLIKKINIINEIDGKPLYDISNLM